MQGIERRRLYGAFLAAWILLLFAALASGAEPVVIDINITDPEFRRSDPTHATWRGVSHAAAFGGNYYHDNGYGAPDLYGIWTPRILVPGVYNVYLHWVAHPNRSEQAPVVVKHAGGVYETAVDQRQETGWHLIGSFEFEAGSDGYVRLHSAPGYTIFDAARFEYAGETAWPEGLDLDVSSDAFGHDGSWTYRESAERAYAVATKAGARAGWSVPDDLVPGRYEVLVRTPPVAGERAALAAEVKFDLGLDTSKRIEPAASGEWTSLGRYSFTPGMGQYIRFSGIEDGVAALEAIRLALVEEGSRFMLPSNVAKVRFPEGEATHPGPPIPVEIVRDADGRFEIFRGGEPYFIRGVAGAENIAAIAESGGNALRTYSHENLDGFEKLDEAYEMGVGVMIGIWLAQQGAGIDYSSPVYKHRIAAQLENAKEVVMRYKDHPAVIAWAIGNEVDKGNEDVWYHVNEIAAFVHEQDPAHPTVAVLAGSHPARVAAIRERAPHIDIIGVNAYKHIGNIYENVVRAGGWDGPYLVTEWGPDATYEVGVVNGVAPIEASSDEKARIYYDRYRDFIASPAVSDRIVGSFAFKLADVAATTHTWYNLLLEGDLKTPQLDALIEAWTGEAPENRAPRVRTLALSSGAYDKLVLDPLKDADVVVAPGELLTFEADLWDPDGDPLDLRWVLGQEMPTGSAVSPRPVEGIGVTLRFETSGGEPAVYVVTAPEKPGDYRLYLYAYDGRGNVGTHTFPFRVAR